MSYKVVVTKSAKKEIQKLSPLLQERLKVKIIYFSASADPLVHARQLVGAQTGLYRWRIGDYRVVFQLNEDVIEILKVQHRREVYRNKK